MGHSQCDDVGRERAAWSAGKTVGTKRSHRNRLGPFASSSVERDAFETVSIPLAV